MHADAPSALGWQPAPSSNLQHFRRQKERGFLLVKIFSKILVTEENPYSYKFDLCVYVYKLLGNR